MKTNLKNFPKLSDVKELKNITDEDKLAQIFPTIMAGLGVARGKWFDDFKKELQEKKEKMIETDDSYGPYLIREILGE